MLRGCRHSTQSEGTLERKVKGQRWCRELPVSLHGVTSGNGGKRQGTGAEEYQRSVGPNLWRARCLSMWCIWGNSGRKLFLIGLQGWETKQQIVKTAAFCFIAGWGKAEAAAEGHHMTTISDMHLVASDNELWGMEFFFLCLFHWSLLPLAFSVLALLFGLLNI